MSRFYTEFSIDDQEWVGLCHNHPFLSHLDPDRTKALEGIQALVESLEKPMILRIHCPASTLDKRINHRERLSEVRADPAFVRLTLVFRDASEWVYDVEFKGPPRDDTLCLLESYTLATTGGRSAMPASASFPGPSVSSTRLWLLRRIKGEPYDEYLGFVVRADNETNAREHAARQAADREEYTSIVEAEAVWCDPAVTTCVLLDRDGPEGVILGDFNAA
jgi:hypothetical protein